MEPLTYHEWANKIHKQNQKIMEPKKKINWARIWQIIRDIILAALTADSVRNL